MRLCNNPDGQNGLKEQQDVTPVNNHWYNMFAKLDVSLNGKVMCSSDYHYAHIAHIKILLNFGTDAKKMS